MDQLVKDKLGGSSKHVKIISNWADVDLVKPTHKKQNTLLNEIGLVDIRWQEKYATWIVRSPDYIYALSTTCTHLGCTPNWLENENKFKCPCHGSGFRKSGINFEGPAPRPLERFMIVLADDGQILIDKNRKFQYEKGQWSDSDSFLEV